MNTVTKFVCLVLLSVSANVANAASSKIGILVTVTLADYTIPSAADLPSFELLTRQTPTPNIALGAKGVGEAGTIGSTPAIQNAVIDAVSHFGVRHIDMPLTAERVWRAIQGATA